jgi:hypothetical protein
MMAGPALRTTPAGGGPAGHGDHTQRCLGTAGHDAGRLAAQNHCPAVLGLITDRHVCLLPVARSGAAQAASWGVVSLVPPARPRCHTRARSPHRERRRRPGRARPPGRSPAARRRSRLHSRRPPVPGPCSVPGTPPVTRWGTDTPTCSSTAVLGSRARRRDRVKSEPGLVFDEAFVDHRQPAQNLLESHRLAHVPHPPSEHQSTSWRGGFHHPDGMKAGSSPGEEPQLTGPGDCLAA